MSALKVEGDERVRAEEAVEIVDCGCASEQTKGFPTFFLLEGSVAPFIGLPV
jgi:hypothetical protein